ncbi:Butyrate kinase [Clostridiaceae bacterium JG1575]|nr:Butyrate kinase [Clostridiaceae bacterium JG1575]
MKSILTINPGSTTTKVAVFHDERAVKEISLSHDLEELKQYEDISDQKPMRERAIVAWLTNEGVSLTDLDIIISRGGLVRPIPTGTYEVTDQMIEDLRVGYSGIHASNLGAQIAQDLARRAGIRAYITDPVACDEMDDVARISGLPELTRRSNAHYLNIKAVGRRVCQEKGLDPLKDNLIICHLGGGISVVPSRAGRIVDSNNANEGGPFSPERAGTLPVADLVRLAFSGSFTEKELLKQIIGRGGLMGYLGTNDGRRVEERIAAGDAQAALIYEAMGYQIAKEVGACAAVLCGEVRAIILTGGLAYSKALTEEIRRRTSFIAPLFVEPGEDEMKALAEAGLRILMHEEEAKDYDKEALQR